MTRSALVAVLMVSALLPGLAAAQCKCTAGDVPVLYRSAQAVFEGSVVSVANPEREPSTVRYTFAVSRAWKGTSTNEKITVVADKAGACAVKLAEGSSHIVGATDEGMGFASLKPCHKFFKPSSAKDAPALRKTLDGFAVAKPTTVSSDSMKESFKAAVAVPAKATKKKKKR